MLLSYLWFRRSSKSKKHPHMSSPWKGIVSWESLVSTQSAASCGPVGNVPEYNNPMLAAHAIQRCRPSGQTCHWCDRSHEKGKLLCSWKNVCKFGGNNHFYSMTLCQMRRYPTRRQSSNYIKTDGSPQEARGYCQAQEKKCHSRRCLGNSQSKLHTLNKCKRWSYQHCIWKLVEKLMVEYQIQSFQDCHQIHSKLAQMTNDRSTCKNLHTDILVEQQTSNWEAIPTSGTHTMETTRMLFNIVSLLFAWFVWLLSYWLVTQANYNTMSHLVSKI